MNFCLSSTSLGAPTPLELVWEFIRVSHSTQEKTDLWLLSYYKWHVWSAGRRCTQSRAWRQEGMEWQGLQIPPHGPWGAAPSQQLGPSPALSFQSFSWRFFGRLWLMESSAVWLNSISSSTSSPRAGGGVKVAAPNHVHDLYSVTNFSVESVLRAYHESPPWQKVRLRGAYYD